MLVCDTTICLCFFPTFAFVKGDWGGGLKGYYLLESCVHVHTCSAPNKLTILRTNRKTEVIHVFRSLFPGSRSVGTIKKCGQAVSDKRKTIL